ncbi:MAG: type II toxin-antitoxin system VapB family antitoxin [Wenzhouxiangella sp.]
MPKPQLSVRSAKARELAHRLAQRERRTVATVVERALEEYEARRSNRPPAAQFYRALTESCATDIDLDAMLEEHRRAHQGIDL